MSTYILNLIKAGNPFAKRKKEFEMPIDVDAEIEKILKPVKSTLKSLGYKGWETKETPHKIDLFSYSGRAE